MLALIAEVAALERPEQFGAAVLPGLRELVPCEIASYNEVRTDARTMIAALDPPDAMTPDAPEVFVRFADQNPIYANFQRTRDGRPYKWSDFFTRRELHATDLYREAYRAMGAEYQMAFTLPAPPELVIGFALNRERRDFAEHDRELLNLIRTPLIAAYATVERYAALVERLAAVERGLERDGAGVIMLEPGANGLEAGFISRGAREALGLVRDRGRLSPRLADWLATVSAERAGNRAEAVPPLLLEGPDGALTSVAFMPSRRAGEPDALLVEPAGDPVSIGTLRGAGLTVREAEVLRLLALGRTNAEIATELTVSVRTIHKHLENVYEKLGARSRTQAVIAAWSIDRRRRALS